MKKDIILAMLIMVFGLSISSCTKSEGVSDLKSEELRRSTSQDVNLKQQELLLFLNNAYYLQQKISKEGNMKELKTYLERGIDSTNIREVSLVMGFDDFDIFNNFFIEQSKLASVIDNQLDFSNLPEEQKLEVINRELEQSDWNQSAASDDCGERYGLCVTKAITTQIIATAGCAALGPFAVPCAGAAAVYAASEVRECQLDYDDCKE